MFHIGLICPPTRGHLDPTLTIGQKLQEQGYKVSMLGWPDVSDICKEYGVRHISFGDYERPSGYITKSIQSASELYGLDSVSYTFSQATKHLEISFEQLPSVFSENNFDLILSDQACVDVPTICEYLKIPFISICNALVSQIDLSFPSSHCIGKYDKSFFGKLKNLWTYLQYTKVSKPLLQALNTQRKDWDLLPIKKASDFYSSIAIIAQQTIDLEYPLTTLGEKINYVGPIFEPSLINKSLNIELDQNLPTIYASLGTINTGIFNIYKTISQACQSLDVNLVISLGRPLEEKDKVLSGDRIFVRPFVNQLALLQHCDLCITHAGMNTTMHSISAAVPMIAIPLGNEQPGIASRIAWSRAGIALDFKSLTEEGLRESILSILNNQEYKTNLKKYQTNCTEAGGLQKAVSIIERELEKISELSLTSV